MKIKSRAEILTDIIKDSEKNPTGWKAAVGRDYQIHSNDYYIFNPNAGCYLLKEYQKNPYQRKGFGSKIARNVDEDIERIITKDVGDFGIIQGDIHRFLKNLQHGHSPQFIFNQAIQGKDFGITIPVRGKAATTNEQFISLREIFLSKQRSLDQKVTKILTKEGIYTGYD
jgi:hypothetical protein